MLSAPAADYRVFSARRTINRQWLMANIPERNLERALKAYLEDDDVWHPYSVLTRWHLMIAEDYGHALVDHLSISDSAAYLDRHLPRIAQDDEQDFPLLRRELEKCSQPPRRRTAELDDPRAWCAVSRLRGIRCRRPATCPAATRVRPLVLAGGLREGPPRDG